MNIYPEYSKKEFEGFTHRFIVKISVDDDWRNDTNLTIYSNSKSRLGLACFLDKNKTSKVKSFEIVHCATKEQDEHAAIFIEEFSKELN